MKQQNKEIYTAEQWERDNALKAVPGQQIEAVIYNDNFDIVPPLALPRAAADIAMSVYKIPVHAGFMMGEAADTTEAGPVYRAFGMNEYRGEKRYYYLGLFPQAKKLDGIYYYIEPAGGLPNDGLLPESYFANDQEAIRAAANLEAVLYRYTYIHGRQVGSVTLYDPIY